MSDETRLQGDANQETEQSQRERIALSRRRLLSRSAVVGAALVPAGILAAQTVQASTVKPAARAARQVWSSTTHNAKQAALVAHVSQGFMEIQTDENAHVALLKQALGSAARPKPTFKGLTANTESTFASMSQTFENLGVSAYIFGAGAISDKSTLTTAAGILAIEARHAGFIDNILGSPLSPNGAVDKPGTQAGIVQAVTPFVASLNGGPDPSGAIKTDADVLNFALLLEYLEAEFYNTNVPTFFGTVGQG